MAAIDRWTGAPISGWPEVAQGLDMLLGTIVGERLERRSLGIVETALLDRPSNQIEIMNAFVAIAEAIEPRIVNGRQYGEPRFDLARVVPFRLGADGVAGFELQGLYYPRGHLGDRSVFEAKSHSLLI